MDKLTLRDDLLEQMRNLDDYNLYDIPEYPGWTFLVSSVVKAYGICPFLNVYDEECKKRRVPWLQSQADRGDLYDQVIDNLVNLTVLRNLESDVNGTRTELVDYVIETLQKCTLPDGMNHDLLIDNIRMRKEAKTQNKKVKDAWSTSLRVLDYIAVNCGFDFSKYIHVVYGYTLRYKAPFVPESSLDKKFNALYDEYMSLKAKLTRLYHTRENEVAEAKVQLGNLINQNFQINQVGRYFKKWSSLTPEKKEDRIKSYCEWYMRKQNRPISDADIMKNFVLEKLASKELRGMDVEWNNKIGMVVNINLTLDDEGSFSLGKRAPKVLKKKRNGRKKKDELFQTEKEKDLLKRINRLLLFEILKGNSINKDLLVKSVLGNLHTRLLPEGNLKDYIAGKYDIIVETIRGTSPP
jgi:hypothetical protein